MKIETEHFNPFLAEMNLLPYVIAQTTILETNEHKNWKVFTNFWNFEQKLPRCVDILYSYATAKKPYGSKGSFTWERIDPKQSNQTIMGCVYLRHEDELIIGMSTIFELYVRASSVRIAALAKLVIDDLAKSG